MKVSQNELKPENYQINAKICRLVEKFPCMYDRSHPHYLKKDVVDKAWIKISKEMDDSIPSCKERWRNIRTSFARSINVNKIPASANRTKPYYLHEELKFLARHITPGIPIPRRSNAYSSAGEESEIIEVSVGEDTFDGFQLAHTNDGDDDDDDDVDDGDDDEEETEDGNESLAATQKQEQSSCSVAESNEPLKVEQPEKPVEVMATIACPPKKRRRSFMEQERPPSIVEQKYSEPLPPADSEFDSLFLQGLLPEMQAMDFRQKILFKRRIYEVISDIFENSPTSTTTHHVTTTTAASSSTTTFNHACQAAATKAAAAAAAAGTHNNFCAAAPTMTVVNAADLAMIRRLNSLLQSPQSLGTANTLLSTMVAAPKHAVASISSTVRHSAPATATVAINRGALTRSTANLMRVTMVNPPAGANQNVLTPQPQIVKQEPEVLDD